MRAHVFRLACAALAGALSAPLPASACILAAPLDAQGRVIAPPRMSGEEVLILYDESKRVEHFIRSLRVAGAEQGFGFIVPVPGLPTVAKADAGLFDRLQASYGYPEEPSLVTRRRTMTQAIKGVEPVHIVSQQRVGSYTATVLAASEAGALKAWLSKNHFQPLPGGDALLEHDVRLGFYFVAFRFEGTKDDAPAGPEAVRISFPSAAPFYPYREPDALAPCDANGQPHARRLNVWFIAAHIWAPRAAIAASNGAVHWRNPWSRSAEQHLDNRDRASELGAGLSALLPPGPLVVETFRDERTHRLGYGDVVFAPADPANAARPAELARLAAIADPAIAGDSVAPLGLPEGCASPGIQPMAKVALVASNPERVAATAAMLAGRGPPVTIHSAEYPSQVAVKLSAPEGIDAVETADVLGHVLAGCGGMDALADGSYGFTLTLGGGKPAQLRFDASAGAVSAQACLDAAPNLREGAFATPHVATAMTGVFTVDRAP